MVFFKVTSWVAISNSSINFIVYGATNPAYRRRFKRFLLWLFCHQNHGIRWFFFCFLFQEVFSHHFYLS